MVAPVLLCGSEVWGLGNNGVIEKVLLKFCKYILKLKSTTTNCMVYGELGRFPIDTAIETRVIGYWGKTTTGKHNKYAHTYYNTKYWISNRHVTIISFLAIGEGKSTIFSPFVGCVIFSCRVTKQLNGSRRILGEVCKSSLFKQFVRKIHEVCIEHSKQNLYLKTI